MYSNRKIKFYVFFAFLTLYIFLSAGDLPHTPDAELFRGMAENFVHKGDVDVIPSGYFGTISEEGQKWYCKYNLVPVLINVPLYYFGSTATKYLKPSNEFYQGSFVRFIYSMHSAIIMAFACLLLFSFGLMLGFSQKVSLFLTVIFGTATLVFSNAQHNFPDSELTLFLLLAVYGLVAFEKTQKKSYLISSAIGLGLAIHTKSYAFLSLPPLLIYHLYIIVKTNHQNNNQLDSFSSLCIKLFIIFAPLGIVLLWIALTLNKIKPIAITDQTVFIIVTFCILYSLVSHFFVKVFYKPTFYAVKKIFASKQIWIYWLTILFFVALVLYYNFYRYGNIFETGYADEKFDGNFFTGLWSILFSPGRGFLLYTPIVLMFFVAYRYFKKEHKHLLYLFLSLSLIQLITISFWPGWNGGWCYGPRYLLQIIPLIILPLGSLFKSKYFKMKISLKLATVILILIGFLTNFIGLTVNFASFLGSVRSQSYNEAIYHFDRTQLYNYFSYIKEHPNEVNLWVYNVMFKYEKDIKDKPPEVISKKRTELLYIKAFVIFLFSLCMFFWMTLFYTMFYQKLFDIYHKYKIKLNIIKTSIKELLCWKILFCTIILIILWLLISFFNSDKGNITVKSKISEISKNAIQNIRKANYDVAKSEFIYLSKLDKNNEIAKQYLKWLSINGLTAKYYMNQNWVEPASKTQKDLNVNFAWDYYPAIRESDFSVEWNGYIYIPEDKVYTFYLSADDYGELSIGDLLIKHNGPPPDLREESYELFFSKGYHAINVKMKQTVGAKYIFLNWNDPVTGKYGAISPEYFYPKEYIDDSQKYYDIASFMFNNKLFDLADEYIKKCIEVDVSNNNDYLELRRRINEIMSDENTKTEMLKIGKIINFENGSYADFKMEGSAFNNYPSDTSIASQKNIVGFDGNYFGDSSFNGEPATGKIISNPFILEGRYMFFKIAGGNDINNLYIALKIDNRIIFQSTGNNSNTLVQEHWDISPYIGKTATIEIVDNSQNDFGYILVDDIYQKLE